MAHMDSRIKNTLQSFFESIKDASTRSKLLEIKGQFLGKNGLITELLAIIKDLPKEERSAFGKDVNQLKDPVSVELSILN